MWLQTKGVTMAYDVVIFFLGVTLTLGGQALWYHSVDLLAVAAGMLVSELILVSIFAD